MAVVLIVIGGIGCGWYYRWSQEQFYVAADGGQAGIYQGVTTTIAGIHLSHLYSSSPRVLINTLPAATQARVRDSIHATGLADAQSIMATLSVMSSQCAATPSFPGCPNTGSH